MTDGTVQLERRGSLALVTLNRPRRKNAMNVAMWSALDEVTASLESSLPRAVVLTGAGGAFSAGMDVNPDNPSTAAMMKAMQDSDPAPVEASLRRVREVIARFTALPVPTIGAIDGLAYGGGAELAVRLDLRVVDRDATICFSETRLGLMPDLGGGVALARLAGPSVAADLILTARRIDAEEALRLGIVDRVSAPGGALSEAMDLAGAIAKNGPRAVRAALDVIRRGPDLSVADALELELRRAVDLIASGECVHGVSALFERRDPDFPDVDG